MKYVKQEVLEFTSSNITQTYPDYDETITYIYEDDTTLTSASTVRYGGYYWRSLTAGNLGNNPIETENIYWVRHSVSNTYAMLDQKSLTKTSSSGSPIIVEFMRGNIDTIGLGYLKTNIVTIEHLDNSDVVIDAVTQSIEFGLSETVYDLWSYIYDEYSSDIDRSMRFNIAPVGRKIRVTITPQYGNIAECGFLIGGQSINMGCTLDKVKFSFNSFSVGKPDAFGNLDIIRRSVQDLVDFQTIIDRESLPNTRRSIKSIYDEIVLFIVDDSESEEQEHMLTLGKIQNASAVGQMSTKNVIAWSIMESI